MKTANGWVLTVFIIFFLISLVSATTELNAPLMTPDTTCEGEYYIIHWPVNGDYQVIFDNDYVGKIERNSLTVPKKSISGFFSHNYSIIYNNSIVFSDRIHADSLKMCQDLYPNLVQITQPDPASNKTSRTLVIHWPEDGAAVFLDGISKNYEIHDSQFVIEIPGNDSTFPKKITILLSTSGFEKGPFIIDSPPPDGGRLDYYPFWELSFNDKYPAKRNGSSLMNAHYPVWSDHIGFGGVVSDCSRDGQYAVAGSDLGLIRLYDREGNILWTYQEPGKPVGNVRISPDGRFIFAAYFYPDPNPKQNVGRIIRFDHNGTVLWKFDSDQPLRGESGSEDGEYQYISWGNFLSVLDNQGRVKNQVNLSEPAGFLEASGKGNLCVVASHRDTFGNFFIINGTGNTLSASQEKNAIAGVDISFDGDQIAVITDHNLSIFFANGSTRWEHTSEPRLRSVALSGNGDHVAVGSQFFLRTFDRNGSIEWVFDDTKLLSHGNSTWVNAVSLSTDGEYTAAGVSENIFFFNKSGAVLWEYASPAWIQRVSMSDDGNFFVASTQNDVFFFNWWGNGSVMETARGPNDDLPKTGIQGITSPSESKTTKSAQSTLLVFAAVFGVFVASRCRRI